MVSKPSFDYFCLGLRSSQPVCGSIVFIAVLPKLETLGTAGTGDV